MASIVLVHGAWHGAWCWDRTSQALRRAGHRVAAPDLPGHGDDGTPPARVSLDSYAGRLLENLDSLAEPAVLVGHSFGGVAICAAAERRPESVGLLVLVAGFLLRDGQSLWRHGYPGAARQATIFREPYLQVDEERRTVDLDRAAVPGAFYPDCSPEDRQRALERWRPEPLVPMRTPVALTEQRFGSVPRAYVRCTGDRVLPVTAQDRMCRLTPCRTVVTLEAGHSPFLSDPEGLAGCLDRLARAARNRRSSPGTRRRRI